MTSPDIQAPRKGSRRSNDISSFIVMDIMQAAAAKEALGQKIIHMEVGQPATAAPLQARQHLTDALETDALGYTLANGYAKLRNGIARRYYDTYSVEINPDRVIITTGSSGAFVLAFLAAFDIGTSVALPSPGYPCYKQILSALGNTPVTLQTGAHDRWMPTATQIRQTIKTNRISGLLVASPANPTGTMLEANRLRELCEVCDAHNIWFISDEIYHGLSYERDADTALRFSDQAIIINSFSKYYSMTGWRVGWMIVPECLIRPVEKLAQNLYISAPSPGQVAALAAFDATKELEANKAVYAANRELLLRELPRMGLSNFAPADGAFYLYCDVSHITDDSYAFVRNMLDDIGIAATPGVDFDADHGDQFVRFSYARATADMEEAVERLKSWHRLDSFKKT